MANTETNGMEARMLPAKVLRGYFRDQYDKNSGNDYFDTIIEHTAALISPIP
jgi:hypothetical protein